jgi:hypothetical protein
MNIFVHQDKGFESALVDRLSVKDSHSQAKLNVDNCTPKMKCLVVVERQWEGRFKEAVGLILQR